LNEAAQVRIGCAGWSLARQYWPEFVAEGTHLQRYASRFDAVEINSSFYRPHRRQTYVRWAESVPDCFRFAVKVPGQITHEQRLHDCEPLLDAFLDQCGGLGDKLGCLLIQLPPSLRFSLEAAEAFFRLLRSRFDGAAVLEPRHESWNAAHGLLVEHRIARVAADPAPFQGAEMPGGWDGLRYWRLHGSPRIYHSPYGQQRLEEVAQVMSASGLPGWCIFDNTASGEAVGDALLLRALVGGCAAGAGK
jgi:uncharacterized protein YecE (DUF72 family)